MACCTSFLWVYLVALDVALLVQGVAICAFVGFWWGLPDDTLPTALVSFGPICCLCAALACKARSSALGLVGLAWSALVGVGALLAAYLAIISCFRAQALEALERPIEHWRLQPEQRQEVLLFFSVFSYVLSSLDCNPPSRINTFDHAFESTSLGQFGIPPSVPQVHMFRSPLLASISTGPSAAHVLNSIFSQNVSCYYQWGQAIESTLNVKCPAFHSSLSHAQQLEYDAGTSRCELEFAGTNMTGLESFCACRTPLAKDIRLSYMFDQWLFTNDCFALLLGWLIHHALSTLQRRKKWAENRTKLREASFKLLMHEVLGHGEHVSYKLELDPRIVQWQAWRFVLIGLPVLPLTLVFLPLYLENKHLQHNELVLAITDRGRLILQRHAASEPEEILVEQVVSLEPELPWPRLFGRWVLGEKIVRRLSEEWSDNDQTYNVRATIDLIADSGGSSVRSGQVEANSRRVIVIKGVANGSAFSREIKRSRASSGLSSSPRKSASASSFFGRRKSVVASPSFRDRSNYENVEFANSDSPALLLESVSIIEMEVPRSRHRKARIHQVACMEFSQGDVAWAVKRPLRDFVRLHLDLAHRIVHLGPGERTPRLPSRLWPFFLKSGTRFGGAGLHEDLDPIPAMRRYLRDCIHVPDIRTSVVFQVFIELSPLSFNFRSRRSRKLCEGYVWKATKWKVNSLLEARCRGCFGTMPLRIFECLTCRGNWSKNWMLLREDHLCYTDAEGKNVAKEIMVFDTTLSVECGKAATGYRNGLIVRTSAHKMLMRCKSDLAAQLWRDAILEASGRSEYCKKHRFGALGPPRHKCNAKLLVDGGPHFSAVYQALESAKSSVYISDWWFTPELPLLRPLDQNPKCVLIEVLKRKAEEGVQIFVVMYREMSLLMCNDSGGAAEMLSAAHKNINVLRHPNLVFSIFLWSHHEKVCLIDESIGFVGGIDLCLGRYDTHEHRLVDGSEEGGGSGCLFPGNDYGNPCIRDFQAVTEVKQVGRDVLQRRSQPRMPWHDVSVRLEGPICTDMARHFLQLWGHVRADYRSSQEEAIPSPAARAGHHIMKGWNDFTEGLGHVGRRFMSQGDMSQGDEQSRPRSESATWHPASDPHARNTWAGSQPALLPASFSAEARGIELGTIQEEFPMVHPLRRCQLLTGAACALNRTTELVSAVNDASFSQDMLPSASIISTSFSSSDGEGGELQRRHTVASGFPSRERSARTHATSNAKDEVSNAAATFGSSHQQSVIGNPLGEEHVVTVQLLRSASNWSYGTSATEDSIRQAYLHLITSAKNFVYIENQFFISSTQRSDSMDGGIMNGITKALADRILLAAQRRESFKVYISVPAKPGFEGDTLRSPDAYICRQMMRHQFESLSHGANSLIITLQNELPEGCIWTDYVGVFCLRNVCKTPDGLWHAAQIYIHSKVLIVDDAHMIVGSANLNDRSMSGHRDSEVCVLIEDNPEEEEMAESPGGAENLTNGFCRSARLRLWYEHFGLLDHAERPATGADAKEQMAALQDPCSQRCWSLWHDIAARRTAAFDKMGDWPSSTARTWGDFSKLLARRDASHTQAPCEELNPEIGKPRPFISEFALDFLADEDLRLPKPLVSSSLMPSEMLL